MQSFVAKCVDAEVIHSQLKTLLYTGSVQSSDGERHWQAPPVYCGLVTLKILKNCAYNREKTILHTAHYGISLSGVLAHVVLRLLQWEREKPLPLSLSL